MNKFDEAFSSFSVNDLQEAKDFYGKTLGLEITEKKEGLNVRVNGSRMFIYQKDNHTPASFTILNFPVANLEQTVDDLTSRGVRFEHYTGGPLETDAKGIHRDQGMSVAWFKDPAGNYLSVIDKGV